MIDDLINLHFQEINNGKNISARKKFVLNYFNSYKINLQDIYYKLLNDKTTSNSIYLLGYFKYHGIITNENKWEAFKLYQKATELGNTLVKFELAQMYLYGKEINIDYNKNNKKGFELSEELSEKKYSCGINMLADCYNSGIGTSVNKQKAFKLYQKAAELGDIKGIYNLGRCYVKGEVIDLDYTKAFELFQKAANSGYELAQIILARRYEYGHGTEKNIDQAIYWYKKSSEQGIVYSVYSQDKLKQLLKN
ncbi:kinase-like domain-containing protein [Rhizophagus irregularis DAOM 181602=DAOM 197198]|nr:kinase-like domain-containing protein [Rhizophagus irregularis DAOM 181602=DAOM 197198]